MMRGLKIQQKWIQKILTGEKTMDVRGMRYRILNQRIALGNSDSGLVEGYATVQGVVKIPSSQISRYEDKHLATEWLKGHYIKRHFVYGFILKDVEEEKNPFPYPKSLGIWFNLD